MCLAATARMLAAERSRRRGNEVAMAYNLTVNGKPYSIDADGTTRLLWVIRDIIGLTGTKYGCGIERCGACTVLMNGEEKRSCAIELKEAAGRPITTIEGLSPDNSHPLQKAWVAMQVPQCGYCQSGQLMACAARLKQGESPTGIASEIGNLCVCGTYQRIREAMATL